MHQKPPEYVTGTSNSRARSARSVSIAFASPKPFSTTLAPSRASPRAIANPIPLVEPVMIATFFLITIPPIRY